MLGKLFDRIPSKVFTKIHEQKISPGVDGVVGVFGVVGVVGVDAVVGVAVLLCGGGCAARARARARRASGGAR